MPKWLYNELKRGPSVKQVNRIATDGRLTRESFVENEVSGLVPLLVQLSALSSTVERAYFCHPSVQHCFKRKYHGSFCGYLNTQMQISYIQGTRAQGHECFGSQLPGILNLQDMIENAWDKGINNLARLQTGGVRGTRKWIGSPEVSVSFSVCACSIIWRPNILASGTQLQAKHVPARRASNRSTGFGNLPKSRRPTQVPYVPQLGR